MKRTLYIIGNGFDLHHNLPTAYSNFQNYVSANHKELYNFFDNFFDISVDDKSLWKDFENGLGTFSYKEFYDSISEIDVFDDEFKPSFCFGLEDEIREKSENLECEIRDAFSDWLCNIDFKNVDLDKKLCIKKDAKFITFNYTSLLESLYDIAKNDILYLHGEIDNSELVFGHDFFSDSEPEFDEDGNPTRTMFTDSEAASKILFDAFHKPVRDIIAREAEFFRLLIDIEEIIVLGHSLNKIDKPYFRKIISSIKSDKVKWEISYFFEVEFKSHKNFFKNLGINENLIRMFKMGENK